VLIGRTTVLMSLTDGCIVPSLVGTGMLDVGYAVRSGVNADLLLYR